jgi:hypothetical protein
MVIEISADQNAPHNASILGHIHCQLPNHFGGFLSSKIEIHGFGVSWVENLKLTGKMFIRENQF